MVRTRAVRTLRAAAKNHESVAVVVDPGDYGCIVEELQELVGDKTAVRGDYVIKGMVVHRIVHPSY